MTRVLVLWVTLAVTGLIGIVNSQGRGLSEKSVIYLSYQPADHGIGLRFDHSIRVPFYLYYSGSYGSLGSYKDNGLKDHIKLTIGAGYLLGEWRNSVTAVTAGVSYHYVKSLCNPINGVAVLVGRPWSFELGFNMRLRRFAISGRTDILRWEPCIDIGIPF